MTNELWLESIKPFFKLSKAEIKALTAWAEARNQGQRGLQAVLYVIKNRVESDKPEFISKAIKTLLTAEHAVCLKKYAFSCYLPTDKEYLTVLNQTEKKDDSIFIETLSLAENMDSVDITGGAVLYHRYDMTPKWDFSKLIKTIKIGDHVFYKYK